MFKAFDQFDQVYPQSPDDPVRGLRRRKTLKQRFTFFVANVLVLPPIALVYAVVGAEGLRQLMPSAFARRIYQLPIPGAGLARRYDGIDRTDVAVLVATLMFGVMMWLWARIFTELQGGGPISLQRQRCPLVFYMLSFCAAVLISFDSAIFYFGLASQTSSGWSNTSAFVAPAATLLYACGLAVLGWWHSDYFTSSHSV